jgi:acetylornithine deacetylase/succinyl-diaminopimelate desuccinylase-like protein
VRPAAGTEALALRPFVEELAALERPSASPGECAAAERIAEELRSRGVAGVDLELEPATGTFHLPLGLAAGLGLVAGAAAGRARTRRGRRAAGLVAAAAAGLLQDDTSNARQLLRRALPRRTTTNVVARAGDPAGKRTLVLVAHHDAAHSGLIFHPGLAPAAARIAPEAYARNDTSLQTGALMVSGPALIAAGALTGMRPLRVAGMAIALGTVAAMADVARRPVVPGANDNLTAVAALLAVAERLAADPVRGVRVLLVSTGSEESFMEGMRGFVRRHRAELDPRRTTVLALECLGSDRLALLEGEGMVRVRDYDEGAKALVAAGARDAGIPLWRGLRLGAGGTDALPAMRAGIPAACLGACTPFKVPSNYHWPTDTPENVHWDTVQQAIEVTWATVRRAAR